jgi:hypothetical protein
MDDGVDIFFVIVAVLAGIALIVAIGIVLYARKYDIEPKQAFNMLHSKLSKLFKRNEATDSQRPLPPIPNTTNEQQKFPFPTPHPPKTPPPKEFTPHPPSEPYPGTQDGIPHFDPPAHDEVDDYGVNTLTVHNNQYNLGNWSTRSFKEYPLTHVEKVYPLWCNQGIEYFELRGTSQQDFQQVLNSFRLHHVDPKKLTEQDRQRNIRLLNNQPSKEDESYLEEESKKPITINVVSFHMNEVQPFYGP